MYVQYGNIMVFIAMAGVQAGTIRLGAIFGGG